MSHHVYVSDVGKGVRVDVGPYTGTMGSGLVSRFAHPDESLRVAEGEDLLLSDEELEDGEQKPEARGDKMESPLTTDEVAEAKAEMEAAALREAEEQALDRAYHAKIVRKKNTHRTSEWPRPLDSIREEQD